MPHILHTHTYTHRQAKGMRLLKGVEGWERGIEMNVEHSCNAFRRRQVARKNYVAREMLQQIRCSNARERWSECWREWKVERLLLRVHNWRWAPLGYINWNHQRAFVRFINIFTCAALQRFPANTLPVALSGSDFHAPFAIFYLQFNSLLLQLQIKQFSKGLFAAFSV